MITCRRLVLLRRRMEIGQTTHANLHQATHGNFPFIPRPFLLLCSTMASLRVCHSPCISPRALGHAPAPLVSDPNGRLQHNVSRHENGRKRSAQVKVVPRKFGALSAPRQYLLAALPTLHQTSLCFSAPSARPANMRVCTCEVCKNGLLYTRIRRRICSGFGGGVCHRSSVSQLGGLLKVCVNRETPNCFVTLTCLLGLPIRTGHL